MYFLCMKIQVETHLNRFVVIYKANNQPEKHNVSAQCRKIIPSNKRISEVNFIANLAKAIIIANSLHPRTDSSCCFSI